MSEVKPAKNDDVIYEEPVTLFELFTLLPPLSKMLGDVWSGAINGYPLDC